jgi:TolB-like protein
MSNDPEQEFFAYGLVEDMLTTLSKLSGLSVIARNSNGTRVRYHTNTERGYLKVLRRRLIDELHGANVMVSKRDADPLKAM